MKHENEPEGLPVCNFCDKEYDPYDKHICAGNMILPEKERKVVEDEYTPLIVGKFVEDLTEAYHNGVAEANSWGTPVYPDFEGLPGGEFIKDGTGRTYAEFLAGKTPVDTCGLANLTSMEEVQEALKRNAEMFPTALNEQQGGDHYRKLPIQPVEYIIANGIGFLAGNVIKYASRYKNKGGADDIRKIKHYCDLILEFEYKEKS